MVTRKALRVLPSAVADFLLGKKCLLEWPQVVNLILPRNNGTLRTSQITLALNISQAHLYSLASRQIVKRVSKGRRGPEGGDRFSSDSVIEFLKARLV